MELERQKEFTHYRGVRGDGNCYYRSVAVGYMERLVLTRNVQALEDLLNWVHSGKHYFDLKDDHSEPLFAPENIKKVLTIHIEYLIKLIKEETES